MHKIKLIVIAACVMAFTDCPAQDKIYTLGEFRIDPANEVVYSEDMVGGSEVSDDGSVIHWDGYKIVRDPKIVYANVVKQPNFIF